LKLRVRSSPEADEGEKQNTHVSSSAPSLLSLLNPTSLLRLFRIEHVFVKYGLESLILKAAGRESLNHLFLLSPTRWLNRENRALPRGERIRLALEELGPVFVKLGQVLSTRRDLLPDDIGDELTYLQDRVPAFDSAIARREIEEALKAPIAETFAGFEDTPLASASVAQVHGACLPDGTNVVVKVLRPGIARTIKRDVALMYVLSDLVGALWPDGERFRAREVVSEYDKTIHGELDLIREGGNADTLRYNHRDIDKLYVPQVYWDYTRVNVLVLERVYGIPIREIDQMHEAGIDMKKLAEHGVEIFYTQVFRHNFFHADMHPGNIFVSGENPSYPNYIAIDFGIMGSLTEQDQHYIGENLLAFFTRDYRRVAQLHVDSGWVPADTSVTEFEIAIRAVCDPIFEKPLSEISFGAVLVQLFNTARRFEMEVQPQLVLLQKTLLNIEGLGRQLYPDLDLWATGKPFLKQWVIDRRGPQALLKRFMDQAPLIIDRLPEMPMLLHAFVEAQTEAAQSQTAKAPSFFGETATPEIRSNPVNARARMLAKYGQGQHKRRSGLAMTIVGATLLLSVALVGTARYVVHAGDAGLPWYLWPVLLVSVLLMLTGIRRQ